MKHFDPEWEAKDIFMRHSEAVMMCGRFEPNGNEELYNFTMQECSYILVNNLIEEKYDALQFNAVRNELGKLLNKLFYKADDERKRAIEAAVEKVVRSMEEYDKCLNNLYESERK